MALSTDELISSFPKGVENLLSPLSLLTLKPLHTGVLSLLGRVQDQIGQTHTEDLARLGVDALEGELRFGSVPECQSPRGVCLLELGGDALGEEDLDYLAAHLVIVKGFEVDVVDLRDIRDQRRTHSQNHLDD